jgi:hypothetical protein
MLIIFAPEIKNPKSIGFAVAFVWLPATKGILFPLSTLSGNTAGRCKRPVCFNLGVISP